LCGFVVVYSVLCPLTLCTTCLKIGIRFIIVILALLAFVKDYQHEIVVVKWLRFLRAFPPSRSISHKDMRVGAVSMCGITKTQKKPLKRLGVGSLKEPS
jgi:hypothetical protein